MRFGHRLEFARHRVDQGRTVDDALNVKNTEIVEELSLPPVKIHCSVLAEDSIRSAIADYKKKNGVETETKAHSH